MRLAGKDAVGAALVAATFIVLLVHNGSEGHRNGHTNGIADAGGSVTRPVGEPITAFVDFNVVPMDRDVVLRHQVVVVRGGFIERLGGVDEIEPPTDAVLIQGDGEHYLIPGLTDAHVHLRDRYREWMPLFVANGITTVFNLEGTPEHLALRRRIREGQERGPTIYTSGPFIQEPEIRTPEDARAAVERQAARGYDFIKIHGRLSSEAYTELLETGREVGIPVIGHVPDNLPFSIILEQRQLAVTHAEEIIKSRLQSLDPAELPSVAQAMAERDMWLMPTVAHFRSISRQWASPEGVEASLHTDASLSLPPSLRTEWRDANPYVGMNADDRARIAAMDDFHTPLIRAMHDAGVPMLAGTDTPIAASAPGFSLHEEIAALMDAGLSGHDALATATVNAGRFIRSYVDSRASFGTIRPGARADILMLEGDPRDNVQLLRRPTGVMVRGHWYDRAELDRMLSQVAAGR